LLDRGRALARAVDEPLRREVPRPPDRRVLRRRLRRSGGLGLALRWGGARAARGRDHRTPARSRPARGADRLRARAPDQRAEDLRPAALRARGQAGTPPAAPGATRSPPPP